jgi:hypothetical protein
MTDLSIAGAAQTSHWRHYLRVSHTGLVRTELGLTETVALFDKGLQRARGMFEQEGVWANRVGPGDRFQLEPIYNSPKEFPPGSTIADLRASGSGTEIGCVSSFKKANWISPAIWVTGAVGCAIAGPALEGLKDLPFSAAILLATFLGVMAWRGYCRFRLARDHDYVLLYMALAVKGQRVRDRDGQPGMVTAP